VTDRGAGLEELVADGRLRVQAPDTVMLASTLEAARADLLAAATVEVASGSWAEAMLYEAGLRAARVIVQAAGFRIAAERGHLTAIDGADALTEGAHHLQFLRLHRMRRMRHEFMYEVRHAPTAADLLQAREDLETLLEVARCRLEAST
jgi:hypothetical protein